MSSQVIAFYSIVVASWERLEWTLDSPVRSWPGIRYMVLVLHFPNCKIEFILTVKGSLFVSSCQNQIRQVVDLLKRKDIFKCYRDAIFKVILINNSTHHWLSASDRTLLIRWNCWESEGLNEVMRSRLAALVIPWAKACWVPNLDPLSCREDIMPSGMMNSWCWDFAYRKRWSEG